MALKNATWQHWSQSVFHVRFAQHFMLCDPKREKGEERRVAKRRKKIHWVPPDRDFVVTKDDCVQFCNSCLTASPSPGLAPYLLSETENKKLG